MAFVDNKAEILVTLFSHSIISPSTKSEVSGLAGPAAGHLARQWTELIAERFMSWCADQEIACATFNPGSRIRTPSSSGSIGRIVPGAECLCVRSLDQVPEISAEGLQVSMKNGPNDALAGLPPYVSGPTSSQKFSFRSVSLTGSLRGYFTTKRACDECLKNPPTYFLGSRSMSGAIHVERLLEMIDMASTMKMVAKEIILTGKWKKNRRRRFLLN